ncbi:MAG: hypothetical protein IJZ68_08325 [Bacteroidaceae bacterium]|nr:hypothetical protein [Bacteroidaceae bacterium]
MNLWIDEKNGAPKSWLYKWNWVVNPNNGIGVIKHRETDIDPVTLISVQASMADEFCQKLEEAGGGTYEVVVHDGEVPAIAAQLIAKHHWDKKVMDNRTAELIMVLKGNHNLAENLPEGTPEMGAYIHDVALYLSDDCMCPFNHYAKNPGLLTSVVQNAVTDYIKACENPSFFVWEYFNAKRQWSDRYTDDQCWCVALMMANVRDNGHYVNGFNDRNTQRYKRQRKFIP